MANPHIHSKSSVKRWGGRVEDYLPLHQFLDSPKATMNNNTSRMLTHNTWFIYEVMPRVFGYNIVNSDGRSVDVVDIAMLHVAEDYRMKFIPTPQDFLKHMQLQPWMHNGVKDIDNEEAQQFAEHIKEKLHV
jgi:hypothetical protein